MLLSLVQILEQQHALFFHLQQQRLIELIRQGKTEEALQFAQEYLAPHGEENEAFLEELGEQGADLLLLLSLLCCSRETFLWRGSVMSSYMPMCLGTCIPITVYRSHSSATPSSHNHLHRAHGIPAGI